MPRVWVWLLVSASGAFAALQPTTTTLTVAGGNPVYGSPISIRAQVNANQGSITFVVDSQPAKPIAVDSNSGATLTFSPSAGPHTVGASFSSGDVYQPSTAQPLTVEIAKASTIIGLSATGGQIGQPVTIAAAVAIPGLGPAAGGTVAFAPAPSCGAVPVIIGIAKCTIAFGGTGSYSVYAGYSGDANTLASTASFTVTVNKAAPSVYVASAPLSPTWGVPATVSALVLGANNVPPPTGSVTFNSGGKTLGAQPLDADGRAAFSSLWAVGSFGITATYSGDTNYAASPPVPITLNVAKASTVLTVSADPAQIGQPVSLHASVALAAGTGTFNGTVTLLAGGQTMPGCSTMSLQDGVASCQTTFSHLGPLMLTGSFTGDANTLPSNASAIVNVTKANPGFYLAASPAAPVYGQSVTLGALLIGATGLPVPSGTIVFSSAGKILGGGNVDANGRASFSVDWQAGTYAVTASYSGDDTYQVPAAAALTVTVAKAPVVFVVSSDPAQIGQHTTLRASVSLAAGVGTIGGMVDFSIAGKPVTGCTGLAVSGGAVSCGTALSQLGNFTLTGTYSGDANTLSATATAVVGVNKVVPGIYIAQAPDAPVFGQPVTLDCLLLPAAGMPGATGTVTFTDSGRPFGAAPVGTDGHASLAVPLATGMHTITALYGGDANYQPVVSPLLGTTVTQAATTTSLTGATGGPFTAVIVPVAPGSGVPTGTVQFRSGTNVVGAVPLTSQGSVFSATLAASNITGALTAAYLGDVNFLPSTSSPVSVSAPQITVTVTSDRNPATAGQAVTFSVLVAASPQGPFGPPTGTVTFSADGSTLGTSKLASGQATLSTTLSTGSHTVTAQYAGDTNYPAASGILVQTVGAAPAAALGLTSSAPVSVYGQPVTLTATLSGVTGSIQFTDGGSTLGSVPIQAGSATFAVSLDAGIHTITASWAGNATVAAGSAQVIQTVKQAATTLALSLSGGGLLASVNVVAPGAGSPAGSVRFVDAATSGVLATIPVANSQAAAPLPSSADAVIAQYTGDANFASATFETLSLLVATNAASYGKGSLAADELVTLFSPNLAGTTAVKITDISNVTLTTSLIFTSAGQVTLALPPGLAAGPGRLAITTPARVLSLPVNVAPIAPGLFSADGSGQGSPAADIIVVNPDGTQTDPASLAGPIDLSGGVSVYLALYGTGIRHAASIPVCTVGGSRAPVVYWGAQASVAGLDQVNILLPSSLQGSGDVVLSLVVDGVPANSLKLSIR